MLEAVRLRSPASRYYISLWLRRWFDLSWSTILSWYWLLLLLL